MGISNYTLVHGKAPEGLQHWPDPDAVFIGGSGGELAELIRLILQRLKPDGWLVMNFVTLENLATRRRDPQVAGRGLGRAAAAGLAQQAHSAHEPHGGGEPGVAGVRAKSRRANNAREAEKSDD